jgi:high-affinity nickel-transport protein
MIFASAFTVFALGLRHGADPDHLAAIDAMTRNAAVRSPKLARFVGALFAGGHTVMVIAIAALIGFLGAHFTAYADTVERIGSWISIAVLLALAALNLRQLRRGESDRVAGAKLRLLPKALRESGNPWLSAVVGLLFGFGFETSSQVAAYATAFGAHAGAAGSAAIGATFCLGMATTDTLDSLLVHRLVTYRSDRLPQILRVWIVSVTICALAVAGYEIAQLAGYAPAGTELVMSSALVGFLFLVFFWIYHSTRPSGSQSLAPRHPMGVTTLMNILRSAGVIASVFVLTFALSLYSVSAARGSDHQDSPTVVKNPLADLTDVFAFPDPHNAKNVVLVMNVDPFIPAGMSAGHALDSNVLYQFKIANGVPSKNYNESMVVQLRADTTGTSQHITLYGPAKPNEVGTKNTLVKPTGTFAFNTVSSLDGGKIKAFAGPRRDPFFFDLSQFFKVIPDRNYQNHPNPPAPSASSFRFAKADQHIVLLGTDYGTAKANKCAIGQPNDYVKDFDLLSIVVEVPKSMLVPPGSKPGVVGLWATTATPDGKSE